MARNGNPRIVNEIGRHKLLQNMAEKKMINNGNSPIIRKKEGPNQKSIDALTRENSVKRPPADN